MASDLISRDALIRDMYEDGYFPLTVADKATEKIMAQPTVDRWIPCSERLPEAGKKVIVWYDGEYWDNQEKFSACTIARYREKHGDWSGEFYPDALDVIAWMPLPEPYKAGDIEDAPTVDAVEVVRCENCKFWISEMYKDQTLGYCEICDRCTDNDDFCSSGTKMDGGDK